MSIKTILLSTTILATLAGAGSIATQSVSADDGGGQYKVSNSRALYGYIPNSANGDVWSKPCGQEGGQWIASVNSLREKRVRILQSYKDTATNNLTWYQIDNVNGQKSWIDANNVVLNSNSYIENNWSSTPARIDVKHSYDNLFSASSNYAAGNDRAIVNSLSPYNGQDVTIEKTFEDNHGTTWAYISLNGSRYIVDNNSLSFTVPLSQVASRYVKLDSSWTVSINTYKGGDTWDRPYGLKGAKRMRNNKSLPSGYIHADKIMTTSSGNWVHLQNIGWVQDSVCNWNGGNTSNTNTYEYHLYGIHRNYWKNNRSPFVDLSESSGYQISSELSNYYDDGAWHPVF